MENGNTQILAEKIALLLQTETPGADFNSVQLSLEKLNQRLDRIESQIAFQNPKSAIVNSQSFHSSQEKLPISKNSLTKLSTLL